VDEPKVINYLDIFKDNLWPGGKLKTSELPRTVEEKLRTRDEANRKLSSLVPGKVKASHNIYDT
jgi:sorting nexin-25